jgi:hypothetical protein
MEIFLQPVSNIQIKHTGYSGAGSCQSSNKQKGYLFFLGRGGSCWIQQALGAKHKSISDANFMYNRGISKIAAKYIPWLMYSVLQRLTVELDLNRITFQVL